MQDKTVKDLMVPLAEYATVSENATLYEAIVALEKAQAEFDQSRYQHRAILVFDKDHKKVVGKLSQMDIVRALEPKYDEIGDSKMYRFGFTKTFLKSMLKHYELWNEPLQYICQKAARVVVKEIMYTPQEGEYVEEKTSLNEAIHQLIMGHHQSLLVTRSKEIIGILRLTDVFKEVSQIIKTCKL